MNFQQQIILKLQRKRLHSTQKTSNLHIVYGVVAQGCRYDALFKFANNFDQTNGILLSILKFYKYFAFHIPLQRALANMNKVAALDYQSSAISIVNIPHAPTTCPPHHNEGNKICKICLEEEMVDLDALIQMNGESAIGMQLLVPCECSGSVGFVHQKCLKTWIYKQIQNSGKKQAFCQICKSQIFFKTKKQKYCQISIQNLSLISGCNILSSIIELFLLIVSAMIFRYSLSLSDSSLLKYVLIVLICILTFAFVLTIALMMTEAFVKTKKEIGRIYSIQQSEALGLREVRAKTVNNLSKTCFNLAERQFLRVSRNGNRVANTHSAEKQQRASNFHFVEINPSIPLQMPFHSF